MKMCVQQKTVFFPVGIVVSSSEQHLRVPLFLCTRIMISQVSTQSLGQLRVTSTQFQEKYPYIARNGKGYLTLKFKILRSVLKFWAS